jgi:hypothetical protein
MIQRRPLGETLAVFADIGELLSAQPGPGLQIRSLAMELPLDLRLVHGAGGVQLIGDLPQFFTRTDFDPEPARLSVSLAAQVKEKP